MTLSSAMNTVLYEADGIQTIFYIPFHFFSAGDILVLRVEGMIETPMSGCAVAGISGVYSVVFSSPPEAGVKICIRRRTARVQNTAYPEGGRFPAKTLEMDLDRLMASIQDIAEESSRAILVPGGVDRGEISEKIFDLFNILAQMQAIMELARKWAENPADAPVEPGHFSALHWAMKALENVLGGVELARKWAENPADAPVEPGHFSAMHWATKALENALGIDDLPNASAIFRGLVPSGGQPGQMYGAHKTTGAYGWYDPDDVLPPADTSELEGRVDALETAVAGKLDASQLRVKAWASSSGAGVLYASFNIASCVRAGAGSYILTFLTPMPDTQYAVVVSASENRKAFFTNKTTTTVEIRTAESSLEDRPWDAIIIK